MRSICCLDRGPLWMRTLGLLLVFPFTAFFVWITAGRWWCRCTGCWSGTSSWGGAGWSRHLPLFAFAILLPLGLLQLLLQLLSLFGFLEPLQWCSDLFFVIGATARTADIQHNLFIWVYLYKVSALKGKMPNVTALLTRSPRSIFAKLIHRVCVVGRHSCYGTKHKKPKPTSNFILYVF